MEQWQLYITELQKVSVMLFTIISMLVTAVSAIIVLSIRIENGNLPNNNDTTYYLDVLTELAGIFMLLLCTGLCVPMLKVAFIMKGIVL
jgi:hypothetical protein